MRKAFRPQPVRDLAPIARAALDETGYPELAWWVSAEGRGEQTILAMLWQNLPSLVEIEAVCKAFAVAYQAVGDIWMERWFANPERVEYWYRILEQQCSFPMDAISALVSLGPD